MDWRKRGACRAVDPELFFPVGHGALAERDEAAAKSVCLRCPVRRKCLDWALTAPGFPFEGIWGGTTRGEREVMLGGPRIGRPRTQRKDDQ